VKSINDHFLFKPYAFFSRNERLSAFFKDSSVVGKTAKGPIFLALPQHIVCNSRRCEQSTTGTSYLGGLKLGVCPPQEIFVSEIAFPAC
jgi:hypothetical protein